MDNDLVSRLKSFFGGQRRSVEEKSNESPGFLQQILSFGNRFNDPKQRPPLVSPLPDPTPAPPAPSPTPDPLQQQIERGIANYSQRAGENIPISTLSGQLAQTSRRLPDTIDPLLATILSIIETGGGRNMAYQNNLTNIGTNSYPSPEVALLGGGEEDQLGLAGVLGTDPRYGSFRESGNLADLFQYYTPGGVDNNPELDQLLQRYASIRALFE